MRKHILYIRKFVIFLDIILCALICINLLASNVYASVYVNGYTRNDGTYVQGHYRSFPNHTRMDNYSTKGNYNPYTGKAGAVNPYNQYGSAYNTRYQRSIYSNSNYGYRY